MLHRKLRCNSYIVTSNACPCDLGLMSSSDIIRIDGGDPTPLTSPRLPPPHAPSTYMYNDSSSSKEPRHIYNS